MESFNVEKGIVTGGNPVTIPAGGIDSLVIGPINDFSNFLSTTYEVSPQDSEVFLIYYDLKGLNSIELKFYNKGTKSATIKGNYLIKVPR
ncbi:hypothetical protein [Bacillus cereus]|uniref:hypothetical protein n=1 Tax=Bacillus cereus TaxID=1396 RepID=UPI0005CEEC54|nr:hypothetical protein [Bacillus cereus]